MIKSFTIRIILFYFQFDLRKLAGMNFTKIFETVKNEEDVVPYLTEKTIIPSVKKCKNGRFLKKKLVRYCW